MGSTLRSLVLRYKADLKDFQKGNRRVIDDIKSSKREIVSLDKEMKKAFTPKVDAARAQIKRLNEQFRAGKMDVQKYGSAVDSLKQKIAAMNRVSAITAHEVGALRGRRVKGANADKALRDSFTGTPGGASIAQILASAPERAAAANGTAAAAAGLLGAKNFGSIGKIAKIGGPAAAAGMLTWGGMSRGNELAAGGKSRFLGGGLSSSTGDAFRAIGDTKGGAFDFVKDLAASYIGGIANLTTYGMAGKYGRGLKEQEDAANAQAEKQKAEAEAAKQRKLDIATARSPMEELRAEQRINELIKGRTAMEVESMARAAEKKDSLDDAARLYAEAVRMEREITAAAKERVAYAENYRGALMGAMNDGERELRIAKDIAGGATPREAAMRDAGGSAEQILRSRGIDLELAKLNEAKKVARAADGHWFDAEGDAAFGIFNRAKDDAARVTGFGDQFATPQELFAKNLKEIQSMITLGLDPAIAHRAMMANANGLAGSESKLGRFAPAAEVGSRQEMALREGAKAQNKQEKKLGELVEIQKAALEEAKKNGGQIKVNLTEVNI